MVSFGDGEDVGAGPPQLVEFASYIEKVDGECCGAPAPLGLGSGGGARAAALWALAVSPSEGAVVGGGERRSGATPPVRFGRPRPRFAEGVALAASGEATGGSFGSVSSTEPEQDRTSTIHNYLEKRS